MRHKAYINSAGKVAVAEYRTGFKPESDTHETREKALAALAQDLADAKPAYRLYVVSAEYRSSDGMIAIFEDLEKAEECYQDNLPVREHDGVKFYTVPFNTGEAHLYSPDKESCK